MPAKIATKAEKLSADENEIGSRRICWPNPDATCLEGGCTYCNEFPFKSIDVIGGYAKRVSQLPHRCATGPFDAMAALRYGLRERFFNVDVRLRRLA